MLNIYFIIGIILGLGILVVSKIDKVLVFTEMTFYVGKIDEKEINILLGGDKCNGEK